MSRKTTLAVAAVLSAALPLAACSSDGNDETNDAATTATEEQSTSDGQDEGQEQPASDIDSAVQSFVSALDDLGIEHTEPVRAEVGLSGAKARFDMAVNGGDSGINVFPDPETMATWQETSDSFGGIHVQLPDADAVLTLNTDEENIAATADLAPQIADAVGGTAHGV
ncbi:hypothetical protein [Corynebacterium glyciniphilum]|uniref:hypothetical protein n=1 Tax=Corynebacterium glyciniphilum TaxID=1404244 RepID=UPI0026565544|nr:hypothetical protein [Corynebacterium glyciniphilum]MDN5684589.1 hypothetical protein [Corynebacterium glyciniphilum]